MEVEIKTEIIEVKKIYIIRCDCGHCFERRDGKYHIFVCPECNQGINLRLLLEGKEIDEPPYFYWPGSGRGYGGGIYF